MPPLSLFPSPRLPPPLPLSDPDSQEASAMRGSGGRERGPHSLPGKVQALVRWSLRGRAQAAIDPRAPASVRGELPGGRGARRCGGEGRAAASGSPARIKYLLRFVWPSGEGREACRIDPRAKRGGAGGAGGAGGRRPGAELPPSPSPSPPPPPPPTPPPPLPPPGPRPPPRRRRALCSPAPSTVCPCCRPGAEPPATPTPSPTPTPTLTLTMTLTLTLSCSRPAGTG